MLDEKYTQDITSNNLKQNIKNAGFNQNHFWI